jgi:hypothetical protein
MIEDPFAEVISVAQQVRGTSALGQEVDEEWLVRFGRVAAFAGEHQVVTPIVCRLTASRGDMVERDLAGRSLETAIRADGAVPVEEPASRLGVCLATGRYGCVLLGRDVPGAPSRTTAPAFGFV